jgi:hypothetical protein
LTLITLKKLFAQAAKKSYGDNVEVLLSVDNINGSLLGRYSIDAKTSNDICITAEQLRCGEISK